VVRAALLLALVLSLGARAAPGDLVLEAELVPERVYAGAEALLKLRLLRAPGVTHGALRPPEMGDAADVSLLGSIRAYEEERAGVVYEVIERSHVIVPRRAGRLVVPGAVFEGALSYEIYNRATGTVPRTATGPARVLQVRPPPAGAGEPWLPARSLTVAETWSRDPDALSTGTPVTRTLVVQAEGLAAERLPRIEMAAHPALLLHHDQPELATEYSESGSVGRRVQRIVLMPVGEAEVSLPEVRVRWWDVGADAPRVATLPGRRLVLHAALAPTAVVKDAEPASAAPALLRKLLVGVLLLVALGLWWQVRTRALREARSDLRDACRRNDAKRARDALLEWSRAAGAPAVLPQRVGAHWGATARAQLGALDAALYAGRAWDGREFWKSVRPFLRAPYFAAKQ
jgi:hypothetical protein